MRRTSAVLTTVLTGLVVPAALLVPGQAVAAPAATEFHIGIVADEGPAPAAGTTFGHEARLVAGSDPVAGATVRLLVRTAGQSAFTVARTVVTDASGYASAPVKLSRSTAYRWEYAGSPELAATTSPVLLDQVGSRVRIKAPRAKARRGGQVVVTGTTFPAQPGKRVSLWRGDKPAFAPDLEMTRVAVATVRADGTFRIVARFARSGPKRVYAKVNGGGGNAEGYSNYVRIQVR